MKIKKINMEESLGYFIILSKLDSETEQKLIALGLKPRKDIIGTYFKTMDEGLAYRASWFVPVIEFWNDGQNSYYRGIYKGKIVQKFKKMPNLLIQR